MNGAAAGMRTQDSRPPAPPTVLGLLFKLPFSPNPQRAESGAGGWGVRVSHGGGLWELENVGVAGAPVSLTRPGPVPSLDSGASYKPPLGRRASWRRRHIR